MTFSDEVIKIFDYFAEQIGIAIDWTAENVVPQLTEILGRYRLFELVNRGVWMLGMLIVLLVGVGQISKIVKDRAACLKLSSGQSTNYHDVYRDGPCVNGWGFFVLAVGVTLIAVGGVYLATNIGTFFKWLIIPEIQYLEMLRGMMPQ